MNTRVSRHFEFYTPKAGRRRNAHEFNLQEPCVDKHNCMNPLKHSILALGKLQAIEVSCLPFHARNGNLVLVVYQRHVLNIQDHHKLPNILSK